MSRLKSDVGLSGLSKKRKRGDVKSAVKQKTKRYHGQASRIAELEKKVAEMGVSTTRETFADMPLSDATKKGLKKGFFVNMTDIQAQSLPLSLQGKDILGAARTGSGKTLAFLIPVLEILLRKKWGPQDGLGALIISPTRELAMQIFDVLRTIGGYHTFSAGLVIGGKNLKDESDRLSRINILVATPGRLLQHMDQTAGFECQNLQILVLDEADRIFDMGFAKALNAIVAHLPANRQTLLFSATQTESITDLARLSLKEPVHISVREENHDAATPRGLEQHYIVCELPQKLDTLFSFIKTHLQVKALVFFSTCKQVRFVFETFCKLHPGISLMHLHGKQKQTKRLEIFQKFTTAKHAFLFATDIAARGLDFPSVDWVIQVDAPEDADTYIHRVGRTARYQSQGKGLLFLLPSEEEAFVEVLKTKGISAQKIKVKQNQTMKIQNQLQSFAFQDPDIKYLGQRAFISYLRSIYLQKNKSVFKLEGLPLDAFAESLGLPGAPRVKFLSREVAKQRKNASRQTEAAIAEAEESLPEDSQSESEQAEQPKKSTGVRTKYDRMFERKNQKMELYRKVVEQSIGVSGDVDTDDEFMTVKRVDHDLPASTNEIRDESQPSELSKRKLKLSKSKKAMIKSGGLGEKLLFDEEGNVHQVYEMKRGDEIPKQDVIKLGREFAEEQRGAMKDIDTVDKEVARLKRKEKKRKQKDRERLEAGNTAMSGAVVENDFSGGYISPEFDLPSEEEDIRPTKRRKQDHQDAFATSNLQDEEALALSLLHRRG